jgi:hypothetical protein
MKMGEIHISEVRQVIWGINDIRNYVRKLKSEIKSGDAYGISSIMKMIISKLQAIGEYLSSIEEYPELEGILWEIYKEIIKTILELQTRLISDALTFEKNIFSVQTLDVINRLQNFLEGLFR